MGGRYADPLLLLRVIADMLDGDPFHSRTTGAALFALRVLVVTVLAVQPFSEEVRESALLSVFLSLINKTRNALGR